MFIQISRGSEGFAHYLVTGEKKDNELTRDEKDNRVCLYGDLKTFDETNKFLLKHKNYTDNYLRIVVGFSSEDAMKLNSMSTEERNELMQNITKDIIAHHASGYDLDNEVVAYAEAHMPKIQREKGKDRLSHIHIGIMLHNTLSNTKLRTTFAKTTFIDELVQKHLNNKYQLEQPKPFTGEKFSEEALNKDVLTRNEWIAKVKHLRNAGELVKYLKDELGYAEGKDYVLAGSSKQKYIKLLNKRINKKSGEIGNVNLNGKYLKHLEVFNINVTEHKTDSEILQNFYKNREELIEKRRSKAAAKKLKELQKKQKNEEWQKQARIKRASLTAQQKIYYSKFKKSIESMDLKGYYFKENEDKTINLTNKKENIDIKVKEDIIESINSESDQKKVAQLMFELTLAKKWDLDRLNITGNKEFKKEFNRLVAEELQKRREKARIKEENLQKYRTANLQYQRDYENRKEFWEFKKSIEFKQINQELDARALLELCRDKYKINIYEYEVVDNKINNMTNRQKPKSIIDFLVKEINLEFKEAIPIAKELYLAQKEINEQNFAKKVKKEADKFVILDLEKQNKTLDNIDSLLDEVGEKLNIKVVATEERKAALKEALRTSKNTSQFESYISKKLGINFKASSSHSFKFDKEIIEMSEFNLSKERIVAQFEKNRKVGGGNNVDITLTDFELK
jgi:hypothetical protein